MTGIPGERRIDLFAADHPRDRVRKTMDAAALALTVAQQGALAEIFRKYRWLDGEAEKDEIAARTVIGEDGR
jgi:hypothetical protein